MELKFVWIVDWLIENVVLSTGVVRVGESTIIFKTADNRSGSDRLILGFLENYRVEKCRSFKAEQSYSH